MSEQNYKLVHYVAPGGKAPFLEWFYKLRDQKTRTKIRVRIDRLERGLFGDCRAVGEGVYELRIHWGPGYRVYFGQAKKTMVIILNGGDKQTQARDIERAKQYWRDYRDEQKEKKSH